MDTMMMAALNHPLQVMLATMVLYSALRSWRERQAA